MLQVYAFNVLSGRNQAAVLDATAAANSFIAAAVPDVQSIQVTVNDTDDWCSVTVSVVADVPPEMIDEIAAAYRKAVA